MTTKSMRCAFFSVLLLGLGVAAIAEPIVGGPCAYRDIPGSAHITSVETTATSSEQAHLNGGPGYAGLEVNFAFTPDAPITDANLKDWAAREHTLRLTNSWYPGPRYVAKYGLASGKSFPAVLKAITHGTCTPFLFAFPGIDQADYFESAK